MSPRTKPSSTPSEFSGKITRQLVDRAEDLFNTAIKQDQLEPVLDEILEHTEELADSERKQLEQIARLMASAGGGTGNERRLSLPGSFDLQPSSDKMFLMLTIQPPVAGGAPVTVDEVLQWLKQRNITTGVDLKTIRRTIEQANRGDDGRDVVIVRGRPPQPGRDARLERYGRRTAEGPLDRLTHLQLESGDIWMCRPGDVVMRHFPAAAGVAGYNALGEEIAPPLPQTLEPVADRHIRVEGDEFITEVAGVVLFEKDRVEARKALILTQDVTRQSDPIDFDGDVQVRAAVRSGARIKATGNVLVEGPVEAAEIESTAGDVILRSGVAGQRAAVIRAARDIDARFAESASLFAGQNINLQVGSLHSRLLAFAEINATQGKGHLAGGAMMAGEKIAVKQLGSRGGVRTDVTVGLGREMLEGLAHLDQLTARATQRRNAAAELSDQIRRAVGDPAKLQPKELGVYTKLEQLQLICDVQIRKLNERRKSLLAEAARNSHGRIEVLTNVMSNVHVTIGSGDLTADDTPGPCTLVFDEANNKVAIRRGR
ncbi:MAG: FapA family protein [Phycisphaeraceae bacterium]